MNIDFETYSEAGYNLNEELNKWVPVNDSAPYGLLHVGAYFYAQHPSTEVISLAYDIEQPKLWVPGMPNPTELFDASLKLKGWNTFFEWCVWNFVCVRRYGWPALPIEATVDTMAAGRVYGLPGALAKAAKAISAPDLKIDDGKRLIRKFSVPRQPTKRDQRRRVMPADDSADAMAFYQYNVGDIKAEASIERLVPPLSDYERQVWLMSEKINARGVKIDLEALDNCQEIVKQATNRYTAELKEVTGGAVETVSELDKIKKWLASRGRGDIASLMADKVAHWLEMLEPGPERRVLELRSALSSASVKKLKTIKNQVCDDGRLHGLFIYYGAGRTGRYTGSGPQPQNLKSSGPAVRRCDICGKHYGAGFDKCGWCGSTLGGSVVGWGIGATEDALEVITYRNLDYVERVFGDALETVGGCLRGLFIASEGNRLVTSDYSAIEAMVLAAMAGEEWRLEVFRTHGQIYEMSAAKITGIPFEEFVQYPLDHNGVKHPMRKKIGKPAELGGGFGGAVGAWKAFGADKFLNDDEILAGVKAWRKASPNIVNFWYRLQDAATMAIQAPGVTYAHGPVSYTVLNDVLNCRLPSGRILYYHQPRLTKKTNDWGREVFDISFMGYNTNPKMGGVGWVRLNTWGGKLTENTVQATARDILVNGMLRVDAAGYPIVLDVHDEVVADVPNGFGSLDQFNQLLTTLPEWCRDWPIKAAGWEGQRYRKD